MRLRGRNMASLPVDILSEIWLLCGNNSTQSWIFEPTPTFPLTKHTHDDRRDLQSFRSICRSLHDAATPKLFRVLEIEFNQKSLSDAEESSAAAHALHTVIKGVRVVLRYCPAPVAATLNSFQSEKDNTSLL